MAKRQCNSLAIPLKKLQALQPENLATAAPFSRAQTVGEKSQVFVQTFLEPIALRRSQSGAVEKRRQRAIRQIFENTFQPAAQQRPRAQGPLKSINRKPGFKLADGAALPHFHAHFEECGKYAQNANPQNGKIQSEFIPL
jgi:hypothetical protein